MANNPIKLNQSTTPASVAEMTDAEMDFLVLRILNAFAATDTGVGTLSVNPASITGLTAIGTFSDTYTDPVGVHPTTTVYTTNYAFYQDLQSATETFTLTPLYVNLTTTPDSLREQSDSILNSTVIARALANLVSQGEGSYYLSSTAPAGGTWVAKATIAGNTDTASSTAVYLWRKTVAASTPTTIRSVKYDTTTTPTSLKEMSDAEINLFTERLRNQIVATNVGKYQLSASAPVTGTWVAAGSVVDTRRTFATVGYGSSFTGSYSGTYIGTFSGSYLGSYSSPFTGSYSGTYVGTFTGSYTGTFSGGYIGPTNYSGFLGAPNQTYTGSYSRAFSGSYLGPFTGPYSGSYVGSFTGSYSGNYTSPFTGPYSGSYVGTFSGSTVQAATSTVSTLTLWVRTA